MWKEENWIHTALPSTRVLAAVVTHNWEVGDGDSDDGRDGEEGACELHGDEMVFLSVGVLMLGR